MFPLILIIPTPTRASVKSIGKEKFSFEFRFGVKLDDILHEFNLIFFTKRKLNFFGAFLARGDILIFLSGKF